MEKEKKILLKINGIPKVYLDVNKNNTIGQIKDLIKTSFVSKEQPNSKIKGKFLANSKTEINVFDTDKYDKVNLSSVWNIMDNSVIEISIPILKKQKEQKEGILNLGKDEIGLISLNLTERELMNFCSSSKETCKDGVFQYYMNNKYSGTDIAKYKPEQLTWKQYFLTFIYYREMLKRMFEYTYVKGDIIKIMNDLIEKEDIHILLMTYSFKGDVEIVKFLVSKGADIHYNRDFSILAAIEYGHLELVKYFLDKGIDINTEYNAPLKKAIRHGKLQIVKYLLERGAEYKPILLVLAIEANVWDIVKYLINSAYCISKDKECKVKIINDAIKESQKRANLMDEYIVKYLKYVLAEIKNNRKINYNPRSFRISLN